MNNNYVLWVNDMGFFRAMLSGHDFSIRSQGYVEGLFQEVKKRYTDLAYTGIKTYTQYIQYIVKSKESDNIWTQNKLSCQPLQTPIKWQTGFTIDNPPRNVIAKKPLHML